MSEHSAEKDAPPTYSAIEALLPEGWELEASTEGGQPNGMGVIEPSDYREWFHDERESHHRTVITIIGPWLDGPTEDARRVQESRARERARAAEAERDLYERLKAKYEPTSVTPPEENQS